MKTKIKENEIIIVNEEGEECILEILFTFDYGKNNYVVFSPYEKNENGLREILAAIYKENADGGSLETDFPEEDCDEVETIIFDWLDENDPDEKIFEVSCDEECECDSSCDCCNKPE